MSFIRGRIDRLIHTSGTFHVVVCEVLEHSGLNVPRYVTATGHLFGLDAVLPGVVLQLNGQWVTHRQHGRQFKIGGWKPWANSSDDVVAFLSSCFGYLDLALLDAVVEAHGHDAYEVLGTDALLDLSTEPEVRQGLAELNRRWLLALTMAELSERLQGEFDLAPSTIVAVVGRFGGEALAVLTANPYRLVEVEGLTFSRVDDIARKRGIGVDDPRRLAAALVWLLQEESRQGHLFVYQAEMEQRLMALTHSARVVGFDPPDWDVALADALQALEACGAVVIDQEVGVYLPDLYRYEREAARLLTQLLPSGSLDLDLGQFLTSYERDHEIQLSPEQRSAVEQILQNRVLVVTGAPGTGKTTLIRTFVKLFEALGLSHLLVAPTGIAAKRLGTVTGVQAKTVHRALGYDGFSWARNRDAPLTVQAVICDETSMVDAALFFRLLDALPPSTILVLVGDDAQLPSVGPGNVLRELIACPAVPTVHLNVVFRQAETSDIVLAAHHVRRGDIPLGLPPKGNSEFRFVSMSDERTIAALICEMAKKLKARDANFQVLSPKYDGSVGVTALNAMLRDTLNPDLGQGTFELRDFHARIGDRLMVIKNDYKLNVYNGDIGKLVEITRKHLRVKIHPVGSEAEVVVDIPKETAPIMLKLAYAVTVHRCQGEEFETVILPLVRGHGRMLQRNLFYTALTRARKKVWILGESAAVKAAVDNDKVIERNTVLRDLVLPAS